MWKNQTNTLKDVLTYNKNKDITIISLIFQSNMRIFFYRFNLILKAFLLIISFIIISKVNTNKT